MRPEVTYFNEISKSYRAEYDRETPEGYSFRVRRKKVLDMVEGGTAVIDIASGPGIMIPGLLKKGCRVTCADAAPEMIARARDEYGIIPDVTAVVGDAYALPFLDKQFDIALAMGLIEYLEDEHSFLRETARVLKDRGELIITFPNYASPWRALNRFFLVFVKFIRKLLGKQKRNLITHREYALKRATSLLETNGFKVETVLYYNFKIIPYPLDAWLPRLTVIQSKLFEPLDCTPLRFIGTGLIIKAKKKS